MRRYHQLVAIAAITLVATNAKATLSHSCYYLGPLSSGTSDPTVPWFSSGATVDVYYSNKHIAGGTDWRAWVATGLTETQMASTIMKAVGIWNEQSGARLRLRFKGGTSATSFNCDQSLGQQCAIVINGDNTACPANGQRNDIADSFIGLDTVHRFKTASISIYHQNNGGQACHVLAWTATTPGGNLDIVRMLVHEFGHSAYAMSHQDNSTTDCTWLDPSGNRFYSVMNGYFNSDGRNLKPWDKEVAQLRYGARGSSAKVMKAALASTGSSWTSGQLYGTESVHPVYRLGSATEQLATRLVGWVDGSIPRSFGSGTGTSMQYPAGTSIRAVFADSLGPGDLVAIASQPYTYTTPKVIYAYKLSASGSDGYNSDLSRICWNYSSDLGLTYTATECYTGTAFGASVHGLSASYNDQAQAFVIATVNTYTATNLFNLSLLVLPLTGGQYMYSFSIRSPTQPAVACEQSSNLCMIAYGVDDVNGSIGWFTFSVDPVSHSVTNMSLITSTVMIVDDEFGLAYDADVGLFRLAKAEKASAIYSYSAPPTVGAGWTGTGDIYNNGGGTSQVSGAAVSTRYKPPLVSKSYAFFELYF